MFLSILIWFQSGNECPSVVLFVGFDFALTGSDPFLFLITSMNLFKSFGGNFIKYNLLGSKDSFNKGKEVSIFIFFFFKGSDTSCHLLKLKNHL